MPGTLSSFRILASGIMIIYFHIISSHILLSSCSALASAVRIPLYSVNRDDSVPSRNPASDIRYAYYSPGLLLIRAGKFPLLFYPVNTRSSHRSAHSVRKNAHRYYCRYCEDRRNPRVLRTSTRNKVVKSSQATGRLLLISVFQKQSQPIGARPAATPRWQARRSHTRAQTPVPRGMPRQNTFQLTA